MSKNVVISSVTLLRLFQFAKTMLCVSLVSRLTVTEALVRFVWSTR